MAKARSVILGVGCLVLVIGVILVGSAGGLATRPESR